MEVWRGAVLVYCRPGEAVVTERPARHSSWTGSPCVKNVGSIRD
jgi:hypothetical protein